MKFLFILSVIFLIYSYLGNNLVLADAETSALNIIKEYSDIPRYTYFTTGRKLTKYPDGFCGGTPVGECDWSKYAEAIVLLSGVTLLIALVTLVFGIIFWVFRGIIFGGFRATHGWFCPGPKYDPDIGEGYTTKHVWILKIVVFVVAIACVPIFIASITGNSKTTSNVTKLGDTIIDKADEILQQIGNFSDSLSDPKFMRLENVTNQIQDELTNLLDEGTVVRDHGEDISDYTDKFNNYRNQIVLAGFIVGIVIVGLIAVSALLNIPRFTCIGALALVIMIPFTWIVFSAHYPINSFLADVCVAYNTTGTTQFSDFQNPLISEVIDGCANQSNIIPVFDGFVELVNNLEANGISAICSLFEDGNESACSLEYPYYVNEDYTLPPVMTAVIDCPAAVECSASTYLQFLNSTVHDFKYGCKTATTEYCNLDIPPTDCDVTNGEQIITCDYRTEPSIPDCGEGCLNSVLKQSSTNITDILEVTAALQGLWTDQIVPIISCSNLIPFVDEIQDIVCIQEVNALSLLVAPSGIFAILLTILGVLAVLGSKRFNNEARSKMNIAREA